MRRERHQEDKPCDGRLIRVTELGAEYVFEMFHTKKLFLRLYRGFPGGTVVENQPANAGDTGSSPGPGRSHMLRSN